MTTVVGSSWSNWRLLTTLSICCVLHHASPPPRLSQFTVKSEAPSSDTFRPESDLTVVLNGSVEMVPLDCSYHLEDGDFLLHLKWFHIRFDYSMVFQWIAGQTPQALGSLKGRVKLSNFSSAMGLPGYGALQIVRPTVDLSGQYVCKVTSTRRVVTRSHRLLVYVPPWDVQLTKFQPHYDLINITCLVRGVYPEPQVTLFRAVNRHTMVPIEGVQKYVAWQDGLYHVLIYLLVRTEFLHQPVTHHCRVVLPHTPYSVNRSLVIDMRDNSARHPPVISISGPEFTRDTHKQSPVISGSSHVPKISLVISLGVVLMSFAGLYTV